MQFFLFQSMNSVSFPSLLLSLSRCSQSLLLSLSVVWVCKSDPISNKLVFEKTIRAAPKLCCHHCRRVGDKSSLELLRCCCRSLVMSNRVKKLLHKPSSKRKLAEKEPSFISDTKTRVEHLQLMSTDRINFLSRLPNSLCRKRSKKRKKNLGEK